MNNIQLYLGKCEKILSSLENNSIDLIVTDPPYGYSFMGKDWDKVVIPSSTWKECLRILKPGAFAFIMSAPRQDVLGRMIYNLQEAGFETGFTSIYWAYASGFPKAENISLHIDKQECKKELNNKLGREPTKEEFDKEWKNYRTKGNKKWNAPDLRDVGHKSKEIIGIDKLSFGQVSNAEREDIFEMKPHSPKAKELEGSFGGFQPKPAVEIIIVCMKPLSEKNYIEQAKNNGKGVTHLDNCRIPYDKKYKPQPRGNLNSTSKERNYGYKDNVEIGSEKGRFPANLLVSNDMLNDGKITISKKQKVSNKGSIWGSGNNNEEIRGHNDSGSFSRYFDLDVWAKESNIKEDYNTFPFLICPKASKNEKNKGLDNLPKKQKIFNGQSNNSSKDIKDVEERFTTEPSANFHPTVKPVKLMSYLITLGSRKGDIILDPFMGSGTTGVACKLLNRKFIGIELSEEYLKIAQERIKNTTKEND